MRRTSRAEGVEVFEVHTRVRETRRAGLDTRDSTQVEQSSDEEEE